ncbi:MAG: hypothetical protein NC548_53495 [Lachnospiraceae bacterium]|nr:hypothetical protein [Lachnospiraceae bacterium]
MNDYYNNPVTANPDSVATYLSEIRQRMARGCLNYTDDGSYIYMEHYLEKLSGEPDVDPDKGPEWVYSLFPGTILSVYINGEWYPGVLGFTKDFNGDYDWEIIGIGLRGREIDGLDVRTPLYMNISYDNKTAFTLNSPADAAKNIVRREEPSYRYAEMSVMDIIKERVDRILGQCLNEEDAWVYKRCFDGILKNASIGRNLWDAVNTAYAVHEKWCAYHYDVCRHFVNNWMTSVLNYIEQEERKPGEPFNFSPSDWTNPDLLYDSNSDSEESFALDDY